MKSRHRYVRHATEGIGMGLPVWPVQVIRTDPNAPMPLHLKLYKKALVSATKARMPYPYWTTSMELVQAAKDGNLNWVQDLLKVYAIPDYVLFRYRNYWTPLHYAAYNGHDAVVEALILGKASINRRTFHRHTALHHACFKGHLAVARVLVRYGANYTLTDRFRATCAHRAAASGNIELMKYILSLGFHIDIEDRRARTPIILANIYKRWELVDWLKNNGARLPPAYWIFRVGVRNPRPGEPARPKRRLTPEQRAEQSRKLKITYAEKKIQKMKQEAERKIREHEDAMNRLTERHHSKLARFMQEVDSMDLGDVDI